MTPTEHAMSETPLGLLMAAERLLREGRKYGLRVVASPAALDGLLQLANHYDDEGRTLFESLATNIVSTDHLFEPNVFPGVTIKSKA